MDESPKIFGRQRDGKRIAWLETRRDDLVHVLAEYSENGWAFWERSTWEVHWYPVTPTERLIAVAQSADKPALPTRETAAGGRLNVNLPESYQDQDLSSVSEPPRPVVVSPVANQFASCFISYSTHDLAFAELLHRDLQEAGVQCWFAPHSLHGGRKLHDQINQAIQGHDKVLLVLSEHSMRSEWVKTEIAETRHREAREGSQVLFPITIVPFASIKEWRCFDADTGKDAAREIREYFILDFSGWQQSSEYRSCLQRLLRDLRPDRPAGA